MKFFRFEKVRAVLVAAIAAASTACVGDDADIHADTNAIGLEAEQDRSATEHSSGPFSPLPEHPDLDDPRVMLGKSLFHDARLSADNTVSCASCHDVQNGGDDGLATSVGIGGAAGSLNAPTVLNSGFNFAQFWDGRATTLEEQAHGPIHNPDEMGSNWAEVIDKLGADRELTQRFNSVYSDGLTPENLVDAIATYERALTTGNSRFDQYLRGDSDALSARELHGLELFMRLGCASCHQGRNVGGNMYQRFGVMASYVEDRGAIEHSDLGRYNVTGREEDKFVFRVPSLRNVGNTAPYFHDGSATSLEEAVAVMAEYQLGRKIEDTEVEAITEFLHTLTGDVDERLQ